MNGEMTTIEVLEGIAEKLWWGWIPKVGERKWTIPFEQRNEKMSEEERQWFREH